MLGLLRPTDAAWATDAIAHLGTLLVDHAHCELKAAQNALSLVARYGADAPALVEPLTALAREESSHFAEVYAHIQSRGESFDVPTSDHYVVMLRAAATEDRGRVPLLLDRLMVAAIIEARSCERFSVLAEHLQDETLKIFYTGLMRSEARHARLFTRLGEDLFGANETRQRFATLAKREATIMDSLPRSPTVHG